jgi:thymidylate synthase (FAD)
MTNFEELLESKLKSSKILKYYNLAIQNKGKEMKEVYGIGYKLPKVVLLQESGIGTSEVAARTCYDSFDNSENEGIKELNSVVMDANDMILKRVKSGVNDIEHSDLLDNLAWTYFHHSILERVNLTYLIRGTSRSVLQELVRHRIAAYSVRSTRYTMSSVINAFVAERLKNVCNTSPSDWFYKTMLDLDLFVTSDEEYNRLQIKNIFDALSYQYYTLGKDFHSIALSKDARTNGALEHDTAEQIFDALQHSKSKRNVGDAFKHIVNDNWKVDLVVTFNLRSLKNYFTLRDSGAAFFQIQWLAQAMKEATPSKYLDLIVKEK